MAVIGADEDFEGGGVTTGFLRSRMEGGDGTFQGFKCGGDGIYDVSQASGALNGCRGVEAHEDRDAALLHRLGIDQRGGDVIEASLEADRIWSPDGT